MNAARWFLLLGAIAGFLSVALGAFAAHALKDLVSPNLLETFQTGVQYQSMHALALLLTGLLMQQINTRGLQLAGWAFVIGIILFSGSLYALSLSGIRPLGMITPFGGLAFLIGWAALARGVIQRP